MFKYLKKNVVSFYFLSFENKYLIEHLNLSTAGLSTSLSPSSLLFLLKFELFVGVRVSSDIFRIHCPIDSICLAKHLKNK